MKKNSIFWISYSDLMTSLFFIMFVLFILAASLIRIQTGEIEGLKGEIKATKQELEKIKELEESVRQLNEKYFTYQPEYKRFKLNEPIQFPIAQSTINSSYYPYLLEVGQELNNMLNSLQADEKYKAMDIKYLLIIEGMASQDSYHYNFELSYSRAYSLYKLWKNNFENEIIFNPNHCEIQRSGSGTDGIREFEGQEEHKNQQFLIHIIPKIGSIEMYK